MKQRYENAYAKAAEAGQSHIFKFWGELNEASRESLLRQAESMDWQLVTNLQNELNHKDNSSQNGQRFEPADAVPISKTDEEIQTAERVRGIGERALRDGKVGAILVAGGQGSRLGFDGPKGKFEIGPVTNKSLFQLHAEKLLALGKKYGASIPWYIMTSEVNNEETVAYFEENRHFGLKPDDVFIFKQGMAPALDENGKLILDARDHIFMSPNGHGGIFKGLLDSGACDHMKNAGLEQLFYFQVDNVLLNMCDPLFLGYHIDQTAEMSAKVVAKSSPEEKVGIIGKFNGRLSVVEYSDMSREDMYATNDNGKLLFDAGSIAIHVLERKFIEAIAKADYELPWHVAHKQIPFVDDSGELVKPSDPNGHKFEMFIFDALGFAEHGVVLEVERQLEFSPVKNANGADSPKTAQRDMSKYFAAWLEKAGFSVAQDAMIEISALYALDDAEFLQKFKGKGMIEGGFAIG